MKKAWRCAACVSSIFLLTINLACGSTLPQTVNAITGVGVQAAVQLPVIVWLSPNTATVLNTTNTAVTWILGCGTISDTGLYTAPIVTQKSECYVTAVSVEEPSSIATSWVTVLPPVSLADNRYCPQTGKWTGGQSDGPASLPQDCM